MSTNNNVFPSRNNVMTSSNMYFSNTSPKTNNHPFTPPPFELKVREVPENISENTLSVPGQCNMVSQSLIFTSKSDNKPKPSGFSKLDSMARMVTTHQSEDFPPQKQHTAFESPFHKDTINK